MDLNTLKSSLSVSLHAASTVFPGRKPTKIDVLHAKLSTHPDLTGFDSGALESLTEACGYGKASCDGAIKIYVKHIKEYIAANATLKKVGAIRMCAPLTPRVVCALDALPRAPQRLPLPLSPAPAKKFKTTAPAASPAVPARAAAAAAPAPAAAAVLPPQADAAALMTAFDTFTKKLLSTQQELDETKKQLKEAQKQLQTTQSAPELKPVLDRLDKLERLLEGVVVGQNNMSAKQNKRHGAVMARIDDIEKLCMQEGSDQEGVEPEDGEQEDNEQEGGEQEDNEQEDGDQEGGEQEDDEQTVTVGSKQEGGKQLPAVNSNGKLGLGSSRVAGQPPAVNSNGKLGLSRVAGQ